MVLFSCGIVYVSQEYKYSPCACAVLTIFCFFFLFFFVHPIRVDGGLELLRAHLEHPGQGGPETQHLGGAAPAQPQRCGDPPPGERLDDPADAGAAGRDLPRHWRHGHAKAGGANTHTS